MNTVKDLPVYVVYYSDGFAHVLAADLEDARALATERGLRGIEAIELVKYYPETHLHHIIRRD